MQKELCKAARGKQNAAQIAEEIADVEIMLEQMKILHQCAATVAEQKARKLARLAERLKNTTPRPAVDNLEFLRAVLEGRVPVPEGTVFNVNITQTPPAVISVKPDAAAEAEALAAEMERRAWNEKGAVIMKPGTAPELEAAMLEAARKTMKPEPGAEINLGERISAEELIKKTVAATFRAWTQTAKDGGCIVLPPEEVAQEGPGEQTEGG